MREHGLARQACSMRGALQSAGLRVHAPLPRTQGHVACTVAAWLLRTPGVCAAHALPLHRGLLGHGPPPTQLSSPALTKMSSRVARARPPRWRVSCSQAGGPPG